jgi:hypothetical protein
MSGLPRASFYAVIQLTDSVAIQSQINCRLTKPLVG